MRLFVPAAESDVQAEQAERQLSGTSSELPDGPAPTAAYAACEPSTTRDHHGRLHSSLVTRFSRLVDYVDSGFWRARSERLNNSRAGRHGGDSWV